MSYNWLAIFFHREQQGHTLIIYLYETKEEQEKKENPKMKVRRGNRERNRKAIEGNLANHRN